MGCEYKEEWMMVIVVIASSPSLPRRASSGTNSARSPLSSPPQRLPCLTLSPVLHIPLSIPSHPHPHPYPHTQCHSTTWSEVQQAVQHRDHHPVPIDPPPVVLYPFITHPAQPTATTMTMTIQIMQLRNPLSLPINKQNSNV